MKKKWIMTGLLSFLAMAGMAQEGKDEMPQGKAIVQVFGNFHAGFGKENDDRGYELERSYLGYEYKFGSSADLGLSAAYEFADWISADAIIVNGEGYKKIQSNEGLSYGLGVTLTPVSGLQVRLYGGWNESG